MPCNSDYMESDGYEQELSKVACLLDELKGKKVINKVHWQGYHPSVYNKGLSKKDSDLLVKTLCFLLRKSDVSKMSLEMQMWWRDHQEADKLRLNKKIKEVKLGKDKKIALNKLTTYEKKLLNV